MHHRLRRLVLIGLLLPACSSSDPAPTTVDVPDAPPARGTIRLRVLVSSSLDEVVARRVVESISRYYRRHGFEIALTRAPQVIAESYLLQGGDGHEAVEPMRTFLRRWAVPAGAEIIVVVLPSIAAPCSGIGRFFSKLEGLTFTSDSVKSDPLLRTLNLLASFTPTTLLSVRDIRRRAPSNVEFIAAHELGHAMGLSHARGKNLMATPPPQCVPPLTADQRTIIKRWLHNKA